MLHYQRYITPLPSLRDVFLKSRVGEIYTHGSVREVYNRKVEMASTRRETPDYVLILKN